MSKRTNIRLEGIMTCQTPMAHMSGKDNGLKGKDKVYLHMKFPVVSPDNLGIKEIAGASGNPFRGVLRENMANMIAKQIGGFKSLYDFRLYFCGGTSKSMKTKDEGGFAVDSIAAENAFRLGNPPVSLFGGQKQGILPSHLRVGHLFPVCSSTTHLMPDYFSKEVGVLGKFDVGEAMFTRREVEKNPDKQMAMLEDAIAELAAEQKAAEVAGAKKKKKEDAAEASSEESNGAAAVVEDGEDAEQAKKNTGHIQRFETIPAGTRLYSFIDVFNGTEEEIGLLVACLRSFSKAPYIGGRSNQGYGRVSLDYSLIVEGDVRNREEHAVILNPNEIFKVNSDFMKDCEGRFGAWLKNLTHDDAAIFGKGKK